MSQFPIEQLQVQIPTEPGLYKLPFPEENPIGHLILWVGATNTCMSFVPAPLQIFEDSLKAFEDEPIIKGVMVETNDADNTNVFHLPQRAARISKNSA